MITAHVSHGAERAIAAAAVAYGPRAVDAILDRVTLADFDHPQWREIVAAVGELRDNGAVPDQRAVVERLRERGTLDSLGGEAGVDALSSSVPEAGALRQVCDDVVRLATWRRRESAAIALHHATATGDLDAYQEAEQMLHAASVPSRGSGGWVTPHEVASRLIETLEGSDTVRWPWPLRRLNALTGGGARRGQMTFIGGASSHGKSVLVDCTLQSMAAAGAKTALFLNEMTVEERAERIASNIAKVRYSRIQAASAGASDLSIEENRAIINAMATQTVAMVHCPGWPIEQIVREARRRHLDVMALDIVQKLPFQPGLSRHQTLEDAVQRLDAFAKDTGCHVILVGQINRARATDTFPVPGLPDIKDCAELGNGPDNVLFVWREQDAETKDPLDDGVIRMAKYRGARLETIPATFTGEFQRWDERLPVHQPRGIAA